MGRSAVKEQAVGIEMDVDDVKSGVRSAGCEKNWITGEGVSALIGERGVALVVV